MLLMAADIFRSIWLIVFPVVTFVKGTVSSHSRFCQATGFLTQMSFEMTDIATLLLAIHTALQVFRAKPTVLGQGGLHAYRKYIYVLFVVVPGFLAAIPFLKSPYTYLSQGPLCSLPIRPFWYRLATSWIPRYLIIILILGLYLAIYIHAEHQFSDSRFFRGKLANAMRRLSDSRRKSRAPPTSRISDVEQAETAVRSVFPDPATRCSIPVERVSDERPHSLRGETPPIDLRSSRMNSSATNETHQMLLSLNNALTVSFNNNEGASGQTRQSVSANSVHRSRQNSETAHRSQISLTDSGIRASFEVEEMRKKRRDIRRQLRLLFIYPIIYFLVWVGPFVNHGTFYNDRFAAHPVYGLAMWSYICFATLGFLDALVFSLREKPWQHIPGSDGTLLSSFLFWRRGGSREGRATARSQPSTASNSRRPSSATVSPTRRVSRAAACVETAHQGEQLMMSISRSGNHSSRPGGVSEARLQDMASWDFSSSRNDDTGRD